MPLFQSLGFEKVFLVGHDFGGPTAYAYACAHPEDVRRLVILDVGIVIDEQEQAEYFQASLPPLLQCTAGYRGGASDRP